MAASCCSLMRQVPPPHGVLIVSLLTSHSSSFVIPITFSSLYLFPHSSFEQSENQNYEPYMKLVLTLSATTKAPTKLEIRHPPLLQTLPSSLSISSVALPLKVGIRLFGMFGFLGLVRGFHGLGLQSHVLSKASPKALVVLGNKIHL
ncbi:hypothetical protein K1719_018451 [Acacia pycnantha]|nr:hypothetical protein K1719_018451 [Acacia pycnantha]